MSLLTVDELKGYIADTAESDTTLGQRITDVEAELDKRFGPLVDGGSGMAPVTEIVYAYGLTLLPLTQEPDLITSVVDRQGSTDTSLDLDDDYLVRGRHLVRVAGVWGSYTTVVYTPVDSSSARRRVLVKLIQLDMNYAPGMGSQSGGAWAESYGKSYLAEREEIMATLGTGELFA